MIRINQVKMPLNSTVQELERELLRILRIKKERLLGFEIIKRSIDARKAEDIHYTYTLDAEISGESGYLERNRNRNITKSTAVEYRPREAAGISGTDWADSKRPRPVVCGSGPAGLFCAFFLAQAGLNPIVLERGSQVEQRAKAVEHFWRTGELDPETNVQFGEGGAGTFSDGKLNTAVKDTFGRIRAVLKTFVKFGAPEDILYSSKPHIGTDCLRQVVAGMRREAVRLGAEFCFETKLTGIAAGRGALTGVSCMHGGKERLIETDTLVLAIGHSARDTFEMLYKKGLRMEAKPFAVGVRVEHEQEFISRAQYKTAAGLLPAADYKVTYTAKNGRGVYSFCMCPGGYVVDASSEQGRLAVNGMSNRARDGRNANSALIVTVTAEDFAGAARKNGIFGETAGMHMSGAAHPLAGVEFQRHCEELAYRTGQGKIPYQLYGDLLAGKRSEGYGRIRPEHKGRSMPADLRECLPGHVIDSILEAMPAFDRMIRGFADEDAVFSGVEMRTSSPVRIVRDERLMSSVAGIYPCGEGAGYAGGITSAAVDGIKVFEAVCRSFCRNGR